MKKNNLKKGFTLVEVLISVIIITLLTVVITTFQKDIFSLNYILQNSLNAQLDARHLTKVMVSELRKANQSAMGAYPIELASSTAITFYSDINNDNIVDKVRYYFSGTSIKKGVIVPTGSPLTYNINNETTTTLINFAVSSSTLPFFQYFPSSYTGTSSPLVQPVDVSLVRLVRINIIIDSNPTSSPAPLIVTSSVSLRNLKDNL